MSSWDDISKMDDLVSDEYKTILGILERYSKRKCPFIAKVEHSFFYCNTKNPENKLDLGPSNPVYLNHVGMVDAQLYCMGDFGKCIKFQEKLFLS